ncbi:ABC transporter substrate-binding protein [Halorussus limi]|uniref:ABC transporter substrate-binding protein n=1 Tax=Halorussus limi TaxID=2938695 RepID=A0A8U0HRS7_9EURY|nr:ABC transporter substrate-binding protein [Halorussus limi]UPV73578.1 ABC transporter substrate-binding protein [Halorussus limi]
MPHRRNRSDGTNDSRRKFLKASGAGAVALSLAGCSGNSDTPDTTTTEDTEQTTEEQTPTTNTKQADQIPEGGTFVMGLSQKPDSPNRLISSSAYTSTALDRIYRYGTTLDPVTTEVRPSVFTDWTVKNVSGDSPKPDVYFNMRQGLKWNDGEDFTKEDVLFTYRYIKKNEVGNYTSAWQPMKKIEESSKSDWDFHIKLKKPVGTWETDIIGGLPLLPKHKWEGKDYQKYNPVEENENGPVGLGPGRLTKWDPGTAMQVTFDNEHYYDTLSTLDWRKEHDQLIAGGPFIDKINFKVYGSQTAMINAFLQGKIDSHYGSMKPSKIPKVKEQKGKKLIPGTDSGFAYVGFNLRRQPIDDATLRQALSFMWDDYFWITRLRQNYSIKGDFAQTPGYPNVRPDKVYGDTLLKDPATNAFDFRSAESAVPAVEKTRKFLTEGEVIDGSKGTYAGKKYPGSLSGVKASQSKSKYEYTFGPVKSDVLKGKSNNGKEIRVDGKTIPELRDGNPLEIYIYPPKDTPKLVKAVEQWVSNVKSLGVPIKMTTMEFNSMSQKVYNKEEFDMYPMAWGDTGAFGSSVHSFFHSSRADDHSDSDGNVNKFMYNSTGYGLGDTGADDLLSKAKTEMKAEKRNKLTAQALEKIYLDMPYMVTDFDKIRWPVNSEKFTGFIPNLVDPTLTTLGAQVNNLHRNE